MLIIDALTRRVGNDEGGFTLIETLVAMVTGLVVTGALFAILEVSLHQSARVVDVVQATQLGRTTMSKIVTPLHSACLSPKFTPVQAKSTENELIFINAYSNLSTIPIASENAVEGRQGAYLHKIKVEGTNLTDWVYPATGGSWPDFTFTTPSPSKGIRIGENISQTEKTPIFQYFGYASESSSSASSGLSTISTTPFTATTGSPLSLANAEATASVLVSFRAAAADKDTRQNRSIDLSTQVTLAFSAPNSEATTVAGPCE
jgi:hypothetical protein